MQMIAHIFIGKYFVPFDNFVDVLHIILLKYCLYLVNQEMNGNVELIKNVMVNYSVDIDP
jgi:hypothetical protein